MLNPLRSDCEVPALFMMLTGNWEQDGRKKAFDCHTRMNPDYVPQQVECLTALVSVYTIWQHLWRWPSTHMCPRPSTSVWTLQTQMSTPITHDFHCSRRRQYTHLSGHLGTYCPSHFRCWQVVDWRRLIQLGKWLRKGECESL